MKRELLGFENDPDEFRPIKSITLPFLKVLDDSLQKLVICNIRIPRIFFGSLLVFLDRSSHFLKKRIYCSHVKRVYESKALLNNSFVCNLILPILLLILIERFRFWEKRFAIGGVAKRSLKLFKLEGGKVEEIREIVEKFPDVQQSLEGGTVYQDLLGNWLLREIFGSMDQRH